MSFQDIYIKLYFLAMTKFFEDPLTHLEQL